MTQIPSGLSPVSSVSNLFRQSLILLLCATPPTAFAQTTTSSSPGTAAVPTLAENLTVTPKFGQTQEQLAADRADCQLWAKGQTGFDPAQYGGGVEPSAYNARRQQYGRAMAACLEGHGYNVHFSAPAVAPPTNRPPATRNATSAEAKALPPLLASTSSAIEFGTGRGVSMRASSGSTIRK